MNYTTIRPLGSVDAVSCILALIAATVKNDILTVPSDSNPQLGSVWSQMTCGTAATQAGFNEILK